jgi:protein-disulfide isomerase
MTTAQGDALLQELRSLRGVLLPPVQAAPAPAPAPPALATVTLSGPALGRTNAPLVLVEFTDFQCPFCKRFHDEVFPQLVRKYVESGQLRIFSRSLPLPFHPNAEPAAQAALCAGEQDKYWAMREKLFATSEDLAATNIVRAAAGAGLELAKFQSCWGGKLFEAAVKNDAKEAGSVGITGTPSFVLGKPQGDKLTGVIIVGAQALPVFEAQIAELLPAPK